MKNSPMYQPGAIGFTSAAGVPKVGQLMNAAWTLSDTCTFKIINVQATAERGRDSGASTSGLCKLKIGQRNIVTTFGASEVMKSANH